MWKKVEKGRWWWRCTGHLRIGNCLRSGPCWHFLPLVLTKDKSNALPKVFRATGTNCQFSFTFQMPCFPGFTSYGSDMAREFGKNICTIEARACPSIWYSREAKYKILIVLPRRVVSTRRGCKMLQIYVTAFPCLDGMCLHGWRWSTRWRLLHLDPLWSLNISMFCAWCAAFTWLRHGSSARRKSRQAGMSLSDSKILQVPLFRPINSQFLPLLRLHGAPLTHSLNARTPTQSNFTQDRSCNYAAAWIFVSGTPTDLTKNQSTNTERQHRKLACKSPEIAWASKALSGLWATNFCAQSCFSLWVAELAAAYPQPLKKGGRIPKIQMQRLCALPHMWMLPNCSFWSPKRPYARRN